MCRFAYEQISDRIKKLNRKLAECKAQNQALKEALEAVEISRHDVNALRKEIAEEIDTWFGDEVSLLRAEAIRKILTKHWR